MRIFGHIKHFAIAAGMAALTAAPAAALQHAPSHGAARKAPAPKSRFSLNTPLKVLLAHPRARAIVAKHLPSVVNNSHLWMFDHKSLNQVAVHPSTKVPKETFVRVGRELATIR